MPRSFQNGSITTTMYIYGHALRTADQAAADKFESLSTSTKLKDNKRRSGISRASLRSFRLIFYITFTSMPFFDRCITTFNVLYHIEKTHRYKGLGLCLTPHQKSHRLHMYGFRNIDSLSMSQYSLNHCLINESVKPIFFYFNVTHL
ncbi:hypothetical protein PALU110988_29025 [Paenibacillus lupini]|nr:hypothetical protein [Paenibacillus lupini]